jgi:hypothetical protein
VDDYSRTKRCRSTRECCGASAIFRPSCRATKVGSILSVAEGIAAWLGAAAVPREGPQGRHAAHRTAVRCGNATVAGDASAIAHLRRIAMVAHHLADSIALD